MFHKATKLEFKENTTLELTFQTGEVKSFDMSSLFAQYPQLELLKNRELFLQGKLMGAYGIIWNDDLDIEAATIYEDGFLVRLEPISVESKTGNALAFARAKANLSQSELAKLSGIDQSDISKIERGVANPSLSTLNRLAKALGTELNISFE